MKAKLIIEGKEFPIEIQDSELQKLVASKKKTGYERVELGKRFYSVRADNSIFAPLADHFLEHDACYNTANYYSSQTVAENNARADELMRQLRRFAVEHRNTNKSIYRYYIRYLKGVGLQLRKDSDLYFCGPWFDDEQTGVKAIVKFHDELIWYFTEYKDSL